MIATPILRKAMHDIADKKGPFTLFGLFMRSDAPGTWDLVVSAPWLDKGQLKATSELAELLAESIGEQALRHFSRIQTINRESPALKAILQGFSVDDGDVRVKNSNLFGLQIEEAVILRAKAPSTKRTPNPAMEPTAR